MHRFPRNVLSIICVSTVTRTDLWPNYNKMWVWQVHSEEIAPRQSRAGRFLGRADGIQIYLPDRWAEMKTSAMSK